MSLMNFQEHFDNTFELIFQKTLVSKEVANTRFESKLKFGESVERFRFDMTGVRVRPVTRGAASVIDTIADSTELLEINLENEAVFHISDGEVTQAGPLNPGQVIGSKIGYKVSQHLDHTVFSEVPNAANTFDAGDLTTLVSTGVPITLDSTTVPQMATRMPAKLRYREQQEVTTNMALVVDSYAAADVTLYLLGKNIDLAGSTFKNGYTGDVHNARLYVSENMLGQWSFDMSGVAVAGEVVTIGGVTFTAAAAPAAPGEFDVEASADAQAATIVAAINNSEALAAGAVGTNYAELTEANRDLMEDNRFRAEVDANNASMIHVYGAGRLIASTDMTNTTGSVNVLNAYYGKRGAIDLVVQDMKKVDMRQTADRRGTNVFSHYLAGLKTFWDGSKMFLCVKIAA
jgi:hypothetical protein